MDFRLYLPKEWCRDKTRREKCGVPKGTKHRTRHELALEMLDEHGANLPHAWITGDDEMGRSAEFREKLRERRNNTCWPCPRTRWSATSTPCYRLPTESGGPRKSLLSRVANWAKASGKGVDHDRRSRRRKRSDRRADAQRPACKPNRTIATARRKRGGVSGTSTRRIVQARLRFVERPGGYAVGGVRPGAQRGASHRGMPETRQERGGLGRLRSSHLGRLASSSNAFAFGELVFNAGKTTRGKKNHRTSPFRKSAVSLRSCCIIDCNRIISIIYVTSKIKLLDAKSPHDFIIGKNLTACLP